jgi:hypothetical protein
LEKRVGSIRKDVRDLRDSLPGRDDKPQ